MLRKLQEGVDATRELQGIVAQLNDAVGQLFGGIGQATQCELFPFRYDDTTIAVSWGRICNRQPEHFFPGGFPIFKLDIVGNDGYIYAKATANLDTLQWQKAEVVIEQSVQTNTTNTAFYLIGTYKKTTDGSDTLVVQGTCGPVIIDICSLAPN